MRKGTMGAMRAMTLVCALAMVAACAPASAARRAASPVTVRIVTSDQRAVRDGAPLRVAVRSRRAGTVSVTAALVRSAGPRRLARAKVRVRPGRERQVELALDPDARQAVGACGEPEITVTGKLAGAKSAADRDTLTPDATGCYRVGVAARPINPGPDGKFGGEPVYLGGYGLGGPPASEGRAATGILGDGLHTRAIVISDGKRSLALADIEEQGWFVATRDGPYGLLDIRKAVETRTGGALKASQVVVQSDHTHGGPDTIGVWGGVPVAYRQYLMKQTVDAIVEAYASQRPGALFYGTAPGRDLLSNQFDYDAENTVVDSDVRVLQARDPDGTAFATMLDFSAHATVLGSSNTKVTGDWVQRANSMMEQRFGGDAITIVGTLGRTQPADRGCLDKSVPKGEAQDLCTLDEYAKRVVDRTAQAVEAAQPIPGAPIVDSRSYLIQDIATNGLLLGLLAVGDPLGIPINRSLSPPWLTGNVIGTVTATARIGDVLLSAVPGEAYPQIPLKVRELVPARGYMTAGLANDQLGYIIAPYRAYPEPIRRSFFNQEGDEVSPIDNDNYFFNVSHTMGERVTCSLLRGAGEVFGKGLEFREAYSGCAPFFNDLLYEAGADTG